MSLDNVANVLMLIILLFYIMLLTNTSVSAGIWGEERGSN